MKQVVQQPQRWAANLLNPSNPRNQSSSSTARIVIEDTSESGTNTIDAALSTSSATLTNPQRLSVQPTTSPSLSGQSRSGLSQMRSFKDYLLLIIGKTIQE